MSLEALPKDVKLIVLGHLHWSCLGKIASVNRMWLKLVRVDLFQQKRFQHNPPEFNCFKRCYGRKPDDTENEDSSDEYYYWSEDGGDGDYLDENRRRIYAKHPAKRLECGMCKVKCCEHLLMPNIVSCETCDYEYFNNYYDYEYFNNYYDSHGYNDVPPDKYCYWPGFVIKCSIRYCYQCISKVKSKWKG